MVRSTRMVRAQVDDIGAEADRPKMSGTVDLALPFVPSAQGAEPQAMMREKFSAQPKTDYQSMKDFVKNTDVTLE